MAHQFNVQNVCKNVKKKLLQCRIQCNNQHFFVALFRQFICNAKMIRDKYFIKCYLSCVCM